jgi:hypothetical protein
MRQKPEVFRDVQWLWQEIHCPECRILQPFSEFLLNASDNYTWDLRRKNNECIAEEVCRALNDDPRFKDQLVEEFPDEDVHVSDERQHFVEA